LRHGKLDEEAGDAVPGIARLNGGQQRRSRRFI
jgi:hypothetical protein